MRNLNKETYWKMMNSFWYRTGEYNPYSAYKERLLNSTDEDLNSKSIEEWNKFSLTERQGMDDRENKLYMELRKQKKFITEEEYKDKLSFLLFRASQEIFYNRSFINSGTLIVFALHCLNLIDSDQANEVNEFIFKTELSMYEANKKEGLNRTEVDIGFSPISFLPEKEWIVDLLSNVEMFGFKLVIKEENKLILPFWDWTMTLVFDSLNRMMAAEKIKGQSNMIEQIQTNMIEKWEPDVYDSNINYRINGWDGEVDFAFIKNEVLYVFENKNITDMHNPSLKNYDVYRKWKKAGIDKGIKQLNRVFKDPEKIFKGWKYSKVVPILCTTSRNRLENGNKYGVKVPDPFVFMDLDSLMILLNINKGYEAILFMSYFAKKNNTTGLFDMVDVLGILTDASSDVENIGNHNLYFDKNFLTEEFEGLANGNGYSFKYDYFHGNWTGDYRPILQAVLRKSSNSKILLGDGFMTAFNKLGNSKKISLVKYIFGSEGYYDKVNKRLNIVGLDDQEKSKTSN